jgi:hypothetical protein
MKIQFSLSQVLLSALLILAVACSSPPPSGSSVSETPAPTTDPAADKMPTTCQPAISPTRNFPPYENSRYPNALGEGGVWAIGFGFPTARIATQYQSKHGPGGKVVWFVNTEQVKGIVRVTGANLQTGKPLVFEPTGGEASTEMTLDPLHPNHPISVAGPNWSEWGSAVYYPTAGCYRLTASWQEKSWSYIVATGK